MSEESKGGLEISDWRLGIRNLLSPIANLQSLIFLFILLLATGLRFYRLDGSSLWSDEGNTWALLDHSFAQIAQLAAADIHPPGYYWLLKIWTTVVGTSAAGMRSFSALCGVGVVFIIYQIGRRLEMNGSRGQGLALLAALLAALNPFQIYYSQEARMYMLLTLESAGIFWALLVWQTSQQEETRGDRNSGVQRYRVPIKPTLAYLVCGILGLWTHYSFPIVLAAAGLAYLWHNLRTTTQGSRWRRLLPFVLVNMLIVLAYAPWLPIAVEQIRAWPKGGVEVSTLDGLRLTVQTLLFGPIRPLPEVVWPWLLAAAGVPLIGLFVLRRQPTLPAIALWLLAPIGLMFGLGLFSDAFLKFLLVASPAWCVAVAFAGIDQRPTTHDQRPDHYVLRTAYYVVRNTQYAVQILLPIGALLFAILILPVYYTNPSTRDNYAGVARYIQAVGDPDSDLVLLNAPGQQEVWRYYDPGLPVLALPQQRPPDVQQTLETLALTASTRRTIFALFWATNEADPDQTVEHWLDQQTFKGLESWQGNLRFVTYQLPYQLICIAPSAATILDQRIELVEQCQPAFPQHAAPGEVVLVGLHWQTRVPIEQRYKVSVQLLDARNQVIAQRDSEPVGGSQPTDAWPPGATVIDNHGVTIKPGTPPGDYQLIAVLYDPLTGERLNTGVTDQIGLGQVHIDRPTRALPLEIVDMQHRLNQQIWGVKLVGYDAYRKDFAHAPDTPIPAGDLVHFTLYWQAPDPKPNDFPADLHFTLRLGDQTLTTALAGGHYPTSQWQPGELVRAEFDLPFDGQSATPSLQIGDDTYALKALP